MKLDFSALPRSVQAAQTAEADWCKGSGYVQKTCSGRGAAKAHPPKVRTARATFFKSGNKQATGVRKVLQASQAYPFGVAKLVLRQGQGLRLNLLQVLAHKLQMHDVHRLSFAVRGDLNGPDDQSHGQAA